MQARFAIGTKFLPVGKHSKISTIVDTLTTYNSKGEVVGVEYLATHDYLGQSVGTRVGDATVARGVENLNNASK